MKNLLLALCFIFSSMLFCQSVDSSILIEALNNKDGSITYRYKKNLPGTYVIVLYFTELENAVHTETNYTVQKPEDTLFVLFREDPRKEIKQKFKFYYLLANPNPNLVDQMIYEPPVPKGESIKVGVITNLSRVTDTGDDNPYQLVTFISDKPFEARAAKDGKVVKIVNDFPTNTVEEFRIKNRINYVTLEHDDGTYTKYKGLKDSTIVVGLGDELQAGDVLGTTDFYDKNMQAILIFEPYYWELLYPFARSVKPKDRYKSHYIEPYFKVNNNVISLKEGTQLEY